MFGQEASSHTVCKPRSRSKRLMLSKRALPEPALTRIQSGFFRRSCGTILIGMRAVLAWPVCLSVIALMLCQELGQFGGESVAEFFHICDDAQIACLRHREAGVTAGIDREEGCEVHVDVE